MLVELIKEGKFKPLRVPVRSDFEALFKAYKEKAKEIDNDSRSQLWRSEKMKPVRAWLSDIDRVNQENWSNFRFIYDYFRGLDDCEEKRYLERVLDRWVEYIRENRAYCEKIGYLGLHLFWEPLSVWGGELCSR